MKTERRTNEAGIEVRAEEDGSKVIRGLAAVHYDGTERTEFVINSGRFTFRERIMPGAFDAAITRDDVYAAVNHDPSQLLGRNTSGTLRLSVDPAGLRYEIDAPDTQAGRDAVTSINRGDMTGSSFAFRVRKTEAGEPGERWITEGDTDIREVLNVDLVDVAPVTSPAYKATNGHVSARDAESAILSHNQYRESLDSTDTDDKGEPTDDGKRTAEQLRIKALLAEQE